MKSFFIEHSGSYSLLSAVSTCCFLLFTGNINAADYASLHDSIASTEQVLDRIEIEAGPYDELLLEPLEQLAKIQLEANRFDDAESTVDRAIQIARFSEGLYTKTQYPLLQLEIDISRSRGDWEHTAERLDHYIWLVANKFDGDSLSQLNRLSWLAESHLECALETTDLYRADFLIKATSISEYAVQLAQVTRNTNNELYSKLLYDLSQKYFVETRGVLGDRVSGNKIRVLNPEIPVMESRTSAIDRRFDFGLEKLQAIRDVIAITPDLPAEALAMAELYIADWHMAFNNATNMTDAYARAFDLLRDAEIDEVQLRHFFSHPVVIPRKTFTLSFNEALAELDSINSADQTQLALSGNATNWQFTIKEDSANLPGLVTELPYGQLPTESADKWQVVGMSVELNPASNTRRWSRGYMVRSRATASDIQVSDPAEIPRNDLRKILNRAKSVSFRPVFRDGVPVPTTIEMNYVVEGYGVSTPPQLAFAR